MIGIGKNRFLVARATKGVLAVAGMVAGYFLGCVLAIQLAEHWLDQYAKLTAVQDDAAYKEARATLDVLKASPYAFCSDAEIDSFRALLFRSEYLKDAGRIRGGRIECSAITGHPARALSLSRPKPTQEEGVLAYSNLTPIRDPKLKRAGLQLGTAYVIIGSHMPARIGPFPMVLDASGQGAAMETGSAAVAGPGPKDGTRRVGDTLYATRCSALRFSCVTASASVPEALRGEAIVIAGTSVTGGLIGILIGVAFSFVYNRSRDLCQQLRRAINSGKLQVVYQPIVNLNTRRIVGAEALARWNDEDGNPVPPDIFIKIAEEHRFVSAITRIVLKRALHDFAEILRSRSDFRLSVNVAAEDLVDPAFMPMLDHTLKNARVEPASLVVEITERSTADNPVAMETIRELRRKGHSIHIDDFGTGYSNLDKLLYLFADTIKIDKAFTKVIGTESVTVAILPQILAMAKSLNLEVVVEGVETEHQANYFSLVEQNVYGQGWLYGRPVTAEEFRGLLAHEWSNALSAADLANAHIKRPRTTPRPQVA